MKERDIPEEEKYPDPLLLPEEECGPDERCPGPGLLMGLKDDSSGEDDGRLQLPPEFDPELIHYIPEHLMLRYRVLPLSIEANTLRLWMVDPANVIAIDDIRLITGFDIEAVQADEEVLNKVFNGYNFPARPTLMETVDFNSPFPLQELKIASRISGPLASTRVIQRFGNPYGKIIEAVYIFPLPAGAAVNEFRLQVADRLVEGRIQKKQQARKTYSEGKKEGYRAALLEMTRDNVLTVRVGNLPPGEQVLIEFSYVQRLEINEQSTTFRFPLVVAPRYIPGIPDGSYSGPGMIMDTDEVPDASLITPPVLLPGLGGDTKLQLSVELECGDIFPDYLACSQHAIALQRAAEGGLQIGLASQNELLDRDFILRFRIQPLQPRALLLENGEHFMLSVMPPKEAPGNCVPRDVIFLLDRSGSMSGEKMVSAREAVKYFISTLHPRDRFAIITFDSVTETFENGELCPATNTRQAFSWLDGITARGGTEIMTSFEKLVRYSEAGNKPVNNEGEKDRLMCAIVITDGQVGNEPQIYQFLQQVPNLPRIFTLGIDRAVNDAFLRQVALLGRGTCELVTPGENLEDALGRLSRETGTAVAINLHLVDRGLNFLPGSLSPGRMPDLFARRPVVITGRKLGQGAVEITGRLAENGEEWQVRVEATPSANPALGILWARDRIDNLQDQMRLDLTQQDALKQEIVKLALQYQLLTRYTSFVLVDRKEKVNTTGQCHVALLPVEMPAGWSMPQYGVTDLCEVEETVKDISCGDFGPIEAEGDEEISCDQLRELVDEAPIIRVVNLIISQALNDRATDIHLEPEKKGMRVRYRIDGRLHDVMQPPEHIKRPLVARLKLMTSMDIGEHNIPQRGKIHLQQDNQEFDLGVSTVPCVHGEKVVVKIKNGSLSSFNLNNLGIYPETLSQFEKMISRPGGLIILAGPSGSGKSTTLYSVLNKLNHDKINVLTIEDPVEHELSGINQVKAGEETGLTIAGALAAFQHQDPDIIMVSDLDNGEAAGIAAKSALQGRLVLSGLYAKDAAQAIKRLSELNADPFLSAASITACLAQRLVRKICPNCMVSYSPDAESLAQFDFENLEMPFYRGKGCDHCRMTGYKGRTGLFELLVVSELIRSLIAQRAPGAEIRQCAIEEGMITMLDDGRRKIIDRETTIEEVQHAIL